MRTITLSLIAFCLMVLAPLANAQVTNLSIQGSSSTFTFVSGSNFSWGFDLPVGDTATCEIWIDVNANGTIDPGTDHMYMTFLQADGVMDGLNGPPDIDGMKNGHITFSSNVGIAPGAYVMRFTDHGVGMQVPGTCTPLASPAYTISGKVTVPSGESAQYVVIEAHRGDSYSPNFWQAVTNANGDFVVQMTSDTAGGQWHVGINKNPVKAGIMTPEEYWVYPGVDPTGINFTVQAPAVKVAGVVVDENGGTLPDWQVWLNRNDGGINRQGSAEMDGSYELGILGVELNGGTWSVQAGTGDPMSTMTMMAQRQLPVLHGGDSLYRRLVIYSVNSQIQGQVRVNGAAPGFEVQVGAWNADTAQVATIADPGTGNFTIGVSDKISTYQIFAFNLGSNYNQSQVAAHPGDTGVLLNLTTTSVENSGATTPTRFALEQNYPNPFNPTTAISFQVPGVSIVKLAVYNILGQEVSTLVNEIKQPGVYTVQFDASNLPSGFYFYRMTAGNFTSTRSMVLLK
jgi:hypothetical protein